MNHSFLCVVGCQVYPSAWYPFFDAPWDGDFDRFVVRPEARTFGETTYESQTH